ncbi:hypothetical protein AGABI1DRAFT_129421 [Agaricus bisporus var. burnettii JB137-S8]|uniref:C2 NT-type domain-containing protein n=1 Tax=Agaricus bisporus var. burnettii (strain JB137-S8 / ATCC MYA-4627 / FGSC 10392) TaxID=597362 RepID=K5X5S8_AGABU|nr:uncharacterized protein AGABI1DRAFT_129421 [Agaricus bisporus var. burnettii JB137-S8]EKM78302.1 hypothetical protein AGABI1DRAFT_129421 [Agaricus bisporus var. burnettii JB137-S8]
MLLPRLSISKPHPPKSSSFTQPLTTTTTTSPSRGSTPYVDLRDHSVHWNYTLSTPIRLDIDRDTGCILPCPFKLVVMQRIQPDDHPSQIHRLGALNLNLSEYVGNGLVDRRYLLRESRTNATLRLTIELEYISGESNYIPPPLPKGEILNGLSNYLSGERSRSRTAHHTIHHGADLYGPYSNQQELELDLFGTTVCRKREEEEEYEMESEYEEDDERQQQLRHATPAFDVERLPLAYGTKTTETLIEAIFNPVRTMEERCESPFTVFIPKAATPPSLGLGLTTTTHTSATTTIPIIPPRPPSALSDFTTLQQPRRFEEVASLYSNETGSSSSSSSGGKSSGGGRANSIGSGGRMRGWWKKVS